MSALAVETSGPAIDGTFGALFIGMVLAAALWGISCVQTWFYFDNYRRDKMWIKILVFATWSSDTIHQILITHALYHYTISHFGNRQALENVVWSMYVEVLFNALTGFLVQSYLAYRIWSFRPNIWVLMPIIALILGELGTSIAYVAKGTHLPTFTLLGKLKPLSMSVNVLAAAGDVAITIAIVVFLESAKSGFTWSNNIINRLMLFSINTGLLTSLCACMSLLFILALPNTLIYFAFYFMIGRFYINSLLATLNSRKSMRSPASTEAESHSLQDRNGRSTTLGVALRGMRTQDNTHNPDHRIDVQVQINTVKAHDDFANDEVSIGDEPDKAGVSFGELKDV